MALSLAFAACLPPWLLGGMRWWQQLIFLGLALIPFACCFLIRDEEEGMSPADRGLALLRFPVFWLGLAFLLYIVIGALNYSWVYTLNETGTRWRMVPLPAGDYISWLPNGVKAPFQDMNPWRVVILYATWLLLVCAAWLGLTRRKAVFLVLGIIAFNAFLIALVTILQKLSGTKEILWHFYTENPQFAGTFIYRNHAGAYLYLGLGCALASAFYHASRTRALGLPSGPAPLFLFFALGIIAGLLFTASRGGVLFGGGIAAAGLLLFCVTSFARGWQGIVGLVVFVLILSGATYFFWPTLKNALPELEKRLTQTQQQLEQMEDGSGDTNDRVLMTKATLNMWEAKPWFGWGAGSYRFMFTKYQQAYPDLFYAKWLVKANARYPDKYPLRPNYVRYAHNDWVQFPAEYGIIGCLPLLGILLYWFSWPVRQLFRLTPATLILYVTLLAFLAHCFLDFQTHNPANLFTFWLIGSLGACALRPVARRGTAQKSE